MIAIDTNILVRVFIDDLNQEQVVSARSLVKKAGKVFVSQIVVAEMIWVLTRAYKISKIQILHVLQEMYENDAFIIEQKQQFFQALQLFKDHSVDFSDCMILAAAKAAKIESIYTFDVKFAQISGVKRP